MIADEVAPAPVGPSTCAPQQRRVGNAGEVETRPVARTAATSSASSGEVHDRVTAVATIPRWPSPSSPALPAGAASAAGAPIQKPLPRNLSRKWCHNAACSKLRDHIAGTCVVAGFHQ